MSIDPKTVAKIAHLARLKIPDEDQMPLTGELNKIIAWVEQLNEVDVAGVDPLANVNDKALRWREDVVTDGDCRDRILANAPQQARGFFVVPKVVE